MMNSRNAGFVVSDAGRPGCSFPIGGRARAPRVAMDAMPLHIPAHVLEDDDEAHIAKVGEFLEGKLSDADRAEVLAMMRKRIEDETQAQDLPAPFPGMPLPGGAKVPWRERAGAEYRDNISTTTGNAMDHRTILAADAVSRAAIRSMNEYRTAQVAVAPVAGHVVGDSAEDVYRQGLQAMGANTRSIVPAAYKGAFDALRQHGHRGDRPRVTTAAGAKSFAALFPDAAPMRQV